MNSTILRLDGLGVIPHAARGIKETIEPIDGAGQLRRTVNGVLRNVGNTGFDKYKITLSGEDIAGLPLDGLTKGKIVTAYCINEFSTLGNLPVDPSTWTGNSRAIVPGSLRQFGDFIFYRPVIVAMVTSFSVENDEYGAVTSWSLELEEV